MGPASEEDGEYIPSEPDIPRSEEDQRSQEEIANEYLAFQDQYSTPGRRIVEP